MKHIKTAVLLLNLGTPDMPTPRAIRRYLREFLMDRRVVEIPQALWWFILNGIVLPLRCRPVAEKYHSIWLAQDSPLRFYTQQQADALQAGFAKLAHPVEVIAVMRYGNPSIKAAMQRIQQQGIERIVLLPLYPQYSATTTATACDAVFTELQKMRNQPAITTVKNFYQHPAYIQALCQQITDYWQVVGDPDFSNGDKLLLSFHGLPHRCVTLGDPYYDECVETVALVRQKLNLTDAQILFSFQSRFGPEKWLQPYTTDTLIQLGQSKTKRLDVFCPGFVSDCLETLEEIAIEGKAIFLDAGGQTYHAIPCLNQTKHWLEALQTIVQEHL
jgi:ferrochelatase